MTALRTVALGLSFCCALTSAASARTIVLTDEDCEQMAVISSDAPRLSWAGTIYTTSEFSNHYVDISKRTSFLIIYPLEKIPKSQRITKAEWIVPFNGTYPATGVQYQVRRLLKSWGPGVSFEQRMSRPERVKWHTEGARGVGQDRAAKPTTIGVLKGGPGEYSFNVTEDVELWYSGAAQNHGWILTAEGEEGWVRMPSPFWGAPKGWKLKITFEPE